MLPICLKKMIAEMKFVSILLFASISIFVIVMLVQLCVEGTSENHDEDYSQYYQVDWNLDLVTGFNIFICANAYQINLFPTYNSLGANKSNKTALESIAIGMASSTLIYISVGILSIYTFGSDLSDSVLNNIDEESNVYSYIVRGAFLLVLACHIPYIFFPTKESFLIIIDEAQNQSMAKAIQAKLDEREKEKAATAAVGTNV